MRADLYGVCALCLFGVINNQLWPYYVLYGFYGMDVFFIVVGYETYRQVVLAQFSKSTPFTAFSNSAFRYLSKLLPIYLTFCGLVVFGCIFLFSPSEFPQLIRQAEHAVLFVSNMQFGYQEEEYFPALLSYHPFEHAWPISLLAQYAIFIVLPLFLFSDTKNGIFLAFVAFFTSLSFTYYWLSEIDLPKNLLDRGWQFGFGFMAFALANWTKLKTGFDSLNPNQFKSNKTQHRFSIFDERRPFYLKSSTLTILLLILMVAPIPISSQIYRPILSVVGFLIVFIGEKEPCLLLDNRVFKSFGKIGFAAYFCFWPLLTLYKYVFGVHWYVEKQDGLLLLLLPYAIGYLTELVINRHLELVDRWWKTLISTGLGYLFVFAMLHNMANYKAIPYRSALSAEQQSEVTELISHLYRTQGYEQIFTERQAMRYNSLIFAYSYNQHYCHRVEKRYFVDKFYYFDFVCTEKGAGDKIMMLIGDKSARELIHGVRHHFSKIYSQLIVISNDDSCAPFLNGNFSFGEQKCVEFSWKVKEFVSRWKGGVDLLALNYQYPEGYEPPVTDLNSDKYFLALQDFYQFMSQHVRERIFLPNVDLRFNIPPLIPFIQKRLFFRLDLSIFSIPVEEHNRHLQAVQKRVNAIECKKCLRVDLSQVFCSPIDSRCYATDLRRKLSYFRDESRLNALGSMFYGEHLLALLRNQSQTSPIFKTFLAVREF